MRSHKKHYQLISILALSCADDIHQCSKMSPNATSLLTNPSTAMFLGYIGLRGHGSGAPFCLGVVDRISWRLTDCIHTFPGPENEGQHCIRSNGAGFFACLFGARWILLHATPGTKGREKLPMRQSRTRGRRIQPVLRGTFWTCCGSRW